MGVLTQCHMSDDLRAPLLLVRQMPNYGDTTVMQVAAETSVNFNFITHVSVQALLNNIWMGRISHDTSILRVSYCNSKHNIIYPICNTRLSHTVLTFLIIQRKNSMTHFVHLNKE